MSLAETMGRVWALGMAGGLQRVADRIVGQPRTLIFWRLALAHLPDSWLEEGGAQPVTPRDRDDWPDYSDGWFTREQARRRLQVGCQLFVLRHDGQNACFGWVERGTVTLRWLRLSFRLPEHVVYLSCLYTAPPFRRQACASRLWKAVLQECKRGGATHAVVAIDPQNQASIKLHKVLGFEFFKTITYRHWFSIGYYRVFDAQGRLRHRFTWQSGAPADLWNTF